jgi:hypothetical protein
MIRKILLGLTIVAFACTGALAQGIKRTPLQKIDFPAGYTTVTAIAEIPAGGSAGRHTIRESRPAMSSRAKAT